MAEVGLVRFAQVALMVANEVLPAFQSKFSKRRFTQPQLLVILLLIRYEDWTFSEAEVRLAEHSTLRAALGLTSAPDHTTLYWFIRRLDTSVLQQLLVAVVERMPMRDEGAILDVDATGLALGAISTFFVNRKRDSGEQTVSKRNVVRNCPRVLEAHAKTMPGTHTITLRFVARDDRAYFVSRPLTLGVAPFAALGATDA